MIKYSIDNNFKRGVYGVNKILSNYNNLNNYNFVKSKVIGYSVLRKEIMLYEISNNDNESIPAVRIICNIHGNETSGIRIWLKMANYICETYDTYLNGNKTDETLKIANLVENIKICLIPTMNPDSLFIKRKNYNNIDLNRNFSLNDINLEPETHAIINSTEDYNYVLSLECHDGAHLMCFPYEYYTEEKTSDNITFEYICEEYLRFNSFIKKNPYPKKFKKGYTMGSLWYPIIGSLTDYMYIKKNLLSVLIEYSVEKNVSNYVLEDLYKKNKEASIRFLELALNSIQFQFYNEDNKPLENVQIKINENNNTYYSNNYGYLAIFLRPGNYNVVINKESYKPINKKILPVDKINHITLIKNL